MRINVSSFWQFTLKIIIYYIYVESIYAGEKDDNIQRVPTAEKSSTKQKKWGKSSRGLKILDLEGDETCKRFWKIYLDILKDGMEPYIGNHIL